MKTEMDFMNLVESPGYQSLKPLLHDYEKIAERVRSGAPLILLPNLYLSVHPGFDIEKIIASLTSYLQERQILKFQGAVPYCLFYLQYSDPDSYDFPGLTSLGTLISEELDRFGHPFGGVLAVDISEWVARSATREEKFRRFLELMDGLDDATLAVYLDQTRKPGKSETACRRISAETRISFYRIELKDGEESMELLKERLGELGFALDAEAEKGLKPLVKNIVSLYSAEGPLTLKQLAEDIAYSIYVGDGVLSNRIVKKDVRDFLPGGKRFKEYSTGGSGTDGIMGN